MIWELTWLLRKDFKLYPQTEFTHPDFIWQSEEWWLKERLRAGGAKELLERTPILREEGARNAELE